ncbi:MAG: O-antigen ligase family protein [Thermoleophilia bacterium]
MLAAVIALSFLSGGYIFSRTAPVVFVLLPLAAVWVWLVPRRIRLGLPALVGLSAFALFALWEGLSIAWSVGPDLSWLAFDVTLLYLIVAAVVVATPAGPVQLRFAGYGFVCAMVPVAVYAFLGKVLPDVVTHAHLYARLSAPVGYWNVLAIMLVMAIVPALEGASRRGLPAAARGACAGALVLFFFTLFFSFSRGGTLAVALALVVYFALTNERLQGALSLALAAAPVAAALYLARHLDTLFNATTNDALRSAQGHTFGRAALVALCVAVAAQVVAALVTRRIELAGRRRAIVGALALAVAVVIVAAGGLAFASRYGGVGGVAHRIAHQFTSSDASANPQSSGAGRLLALGSNGRIPMVREGLKGFPHHPLAGTGAGTFRFTNYLYRPNGSFVVKHAHNQWINVLSELGLVGLVLFVVALGGLLVAALRPVGRAARDADRGLLAALQAVSIAFVAHMTIDWDWDMAAAGVAFLLLTGVAAAYVRGRRVSLAVDTPSARHAAHGAREGLRFGIASRVLATGVLALVAASFLLPYLSGRSLSQAIVQAGDNHTTTAIAQAHRAHRLDPLAVDPLFTLALVEQQEGRASEALGTLQRAVRLQPQNYSAYYELGLMQLNVLGRRAEAAASFRRALSLNPYDDNSSFELGVARVPAATP